MLLVSLVVAAWLSGSLGGTEWSQAPEPLHFVAALAGEHVAPAPVGTAASAQATGVLVGHRFTIHGSFTALSSALRDIAKTPDDPGIHLHRGAAGETTPYFFGLRVRLNADERSGIFWGTAELTDEQRALLLSQRLYVDVHTVQHGPGELRDQWRPVDPGAAARALAAATVGAPIVHSAACHTPETQP